MSEPVNIYHAKTGQRLTMYAPSTAAQLVSSGEYTTSPVPLTPGVRPGGRNFSDEELAIFLAEGSIGRASARACEVLANEWSAQAGTQRLGPMSEARNQAERYEARAKHLRLAYGHSSDNTQAAGFTSQIFVRSA